MKSYICIVYFNKHQEFPGSNYIKEKGHDLIKLLDFILENEFVNHTELQNEQKLFLAKDVEFRILLGILSEFGKYARYYNFDIITGNSKPNVNVKKDWQDFERSIWDKKPEIYNKLLDNDTFGEIANDVSSYVINILEKFISYLSLQLSMGFLGSEGQKYISILSDFIFLNEEKFGKTMAKLIIVKI
jgi:hypothetical protein